MPPQNLSPWIPLKTRVFECIFETDTGYLRPVKTAGVEVLRAIYGAVRDKNWDTVSPELTVRRLEQGEDDFWLEFTAQCEQAPVSFWWEGTIHGQGGLLKFRFEGQARSGFLRNRIGLCILHPIKECAGKPCRSQHTDGRWIDGEFPRYISPHQPVKNLQALSWNPAENVQAEIRFEGETFEMEDQRNWTDASFKTYSTPLELPFPVEVDAGERICQRVILYTTTQGSLAIALKEDPPLTLTFSSTPLTNPPPKLGLGMASHGLPLSEGERQRLAQLRLNHLRVDLYFSREDWKAALRQARDEAAAIGSGLQCALFLDDSPEQSLADFRNLIGPEAVDACLIFHEGEKSTLSRWLALAERHLASHGFRLVTGTNAYFAELNRQRPPQGAVVCYSITPQVHAFDALSLMETLEAQPATVESALQFCDRELVISPITLRPRFNPNATTSSAEPQGQLPSTVDPRQRTLFGAAWTLGALSRLAPLDRVESLTFYETTGWRGLMEMEAGSPDPERFGTTPGETFPVYHVFEALAGTQRLLPVNVSDPQRVAALAIAREGGRSSVLLANLTGCDQRVEFMHSLTGLSAATINEASLPALRAGISPAWQSLAPDPHPTLLSLDPYALIKLELS
ncbi:MAG: hypothetical protein JO069_05775 [Verrucomicrobia bacterium]|nr:hypothetical protein [Verrucomicrobiota bacterium]